MATESPDVTWSDQLPARDKFRPMQLLLDDRDILSISPAPRTYRRLRRDRRRIYRMYAAEFRRDAIQITRERLSHIAAASDWDDLRPTLLNAATHAFTWTGFHCAWLLHGLHIGDATNIVRYLLSFSRPQQAPVKAEI
jgi:hypothetical protein